MILESQPDLEVVAEAVDGAHTLAIVRRTPTDVVLMDIRMPRVSGLVAAGRITTDAQTRELGPVPRIVLVTALDLDDSVAAAAGAGAYAILYKDTPPEVLLEAIRGAAAHRGQE